MVMINNPILIYFNRALEFANLSKNEVFLQDVSSAKEKETKTNSKLKTYSEDSYIALVELEKKTGDKVYHLYANFEVLSKLDENTIYCHFYNALSYIKTTFLGIKGFEQGFIYTGLLRISKLEDTLNTRYNRFYSDLSDMYNEIYNVNYYVSAIRKLFNSMNDKEIFNELYDLNFIGLDLEKFLFIAINEFVGMGVAFNDLIRIFKVLFTYFNYKNFRFDEGYNLFIKTYNRDYYAKYAESKINGYKFILLIDSYLEDKITMNELKIELFEYFTILINKENKQKGRASFLNVSKTPSFGMLSFEI